jgi:hypothetical protein
MFATPARATSVRPHSTFCRELKKEGGTSLGLNVEELPMPKKAKHIEKQLKKLVKHADCVEDDHEMRRADGKRKSDSDYVNLVMSPKYQKTKTKFEKHMTPYEMGDAP